MPKLPAVYIHFEKSHVQTLLVLIRVTLGKGSTSFLPFTSQ